VSNVTSLPVVDLRDDPGQLRWKLREMAHEVGFSISPAMGWRNRSPAGCSTWCMSCSGCRRPKRTPSRWWREQIDIGPERPPAGAPGNDGWVEVPPMEGAFIVNIGELLEVATAGVCARPSTGLNCTSQRPSEFRYRTLQPAARRTNPCVFAARRTGGAGPHAVRPLRSPLLGLRSQRVEEQTACSSGCCRRARILLTHIAEQATLHG
jgi:hypothetical protein